MSHTDHDKYKYLHNSMLMATCALLVVFALGMFSSKSPSTTIAHGEHRRTPAVDQVVLVLVDALRPDFAISSLTPGGDGFSCEPTTTLAPRYASATLTYIEDALTAPAGSPSRPALGAFFIADAPTTTAQRLKALTTGVVPALIEAGSNFASDAIVEDNIIVQLNGSCAVLGDDTWLSLFPMGGEADDQPRVWKETRVFPSFQVDDLDTNDDGVLGVLEEFVERGWRSGTKLILAHFLGVDHAGHTFHANHTAMHKKLAQLNVMLRHLSQYLARRAQQEPHRSTLLLVLGDHGMTDSGDHGGSSTMETDSFLFAEVFGGGGQEHKGRKARALGHIERRWKRCRRHQDDWDDTCRLVRCSTPSSWRGESLPLSAFRQVDLVPTLSWLLGTRIPFSSSGRVVEELVALVGANTEGRREALLRENCQQLATMLTGAVVGSDAMHSSECRSDNTEGDVCHALPIERLEQCMASMSRTVQRSTLHVRWPVVLLSLGVACAMTLWCAAVALRPVLALPSTPNSTGTQDAALRVVLPLTVICVVGLHFSNSFVVYEASITTSILGLVALALVVPGGVKGTGPEAPRRLLGLVALFVCISLPGGWRHRSHGTHHLEGVRSLWDSLLHPPPLHSTVVVDAVVWGVFSAASYVAHPHERQAKHRRRTTTHWGVDAVTAACWLSLAHVVGPHTAVLVVVAFVVGLSTTRGLRQSTSYVCAALWLCSLCDPSHPTWRLQVAAFSALLRVCTAPLVASRSVCSSLAVPMLMFLLAGCAFFGHGQQNTFTSIDWTSSTVGGVESDILVGSIGLSGVLWWKGFLVMSRTFGTSVLPILALWRSSRSTDDAAVSQVLARHCRWYGLLWVVKALCAAMAAVILRGHLMVVAIFGPNVMFCTLHAVVVVAGAMMVGV
jgi:GPI ethanolamine phosphate transferase 3 subunit O